MVSNLTVKPVSFAQQGGSRVLAPQGKTPADKPPVRFAGDKDIMVVDDEQRALNNTVIFAKRALDNPGQYTFHKVLANPAQPETHQSDDTVLIEANGRATADELEELAEELNPAMTLTAYNMPPARGGTVIPKLKAHTKDGNVVVRTANWYASDHDNPFRERRARQAGAQKCEDELGVKYVQQRDPEMLQAMIQSIMEGSPMPAYDFNGGEYSSIGKPNNNDDPFVNEQTDERYADAVPVPLLQKVKSKLGL